VTRPLQGQFVARRLGLSVLSPHIKSEMSTIICNEEMKGKAKCKNSRFEPHFGGLRGNSQGSSMARCKARCQFLLVLIKFFSLAFIADLAPIGSPPRAFQRVYVTHKSPKEWLRTRISTFGVALHFFVTCIRRHFKLNMWVKHSKSQPTENKTSLKWAWSRQVTYFKLLVPLRYLWNGLIERLQIWCAC